MGPGRPIKPVSELVRGDFKLTHYRQYVAPPALLPSTGHRGNEEEEDEEGGAEAEPLSRAEILAAMARGLAQGSVPVSALGDGVGSALAGRRSGGGRGGAPTDVDALD